MQHCKLALFGAVLATLECLFVSPIPALASPYSDGNAAYKAHDYAAAIDDFRLATSELSGPEKAKAYYKLGLAYRKDNLPVDAYNALEDARSADPTLSFASSPGKFQEIEQSVNPQAAPAVTSPTSNTAAGTQDPAAATLGASDVYIEQSMLPYVNAPSLAQIAQNDDHTTVKIVILRTLPPEYSSAAQYAAELYNYLDLGKNAIIVYAQRLSTGQPGGVGIDAGTLSLTELQGLAQKYVAQIGDGNITAGISALASATTTEIDAKEEQMPNLVMTAVLIALVIFALLIFAASRRKKAVMNAIRQPLNTLRDNVLQNIQYIDNYADVLPKNNADTDQVKAYRQAAEAKFEQADKIMIKATDPSELYRAQSILDKANSDLAKGRQFLDRATGGASKIPGDDAIRPPDIADTLSDLDQIPTQHRGVSFFSSQPAPLSNLEPVTLEIDGQIRTVMATPTEAAQIRNGQIPPVRAFNLNGQMVPWYNYQHYDPYRDYYRYENQGWGGFGSGALAGFIGAELLGSLFRPNYYGNWNSPYGYSPGFDSFGGWDNYGNGGGFGQGLFGGGIGGNLPFQDQYTQPAQDIGGGASFLGSGYDQSDYGNSGGSNFFGGGGDQS